VIPGDVYRGSADSLQAQLQHQQAQAARAQRHVQRLRRVLRVRLLRVLVRLPLAAVVGYGSGSGCGSAVSSVVNAWLLPAPPAVAAPAPSLASDPACQCVQRDPSGWWRWHCSEPACTVTQPIDVWGVPPAPRPGDGPPPAEGTTYNGGRTRLRYYSPITTATTGTVSTSAVISVTSGATTGAGTVLP